MLWENSFPKNWFDDQEADDEEKEKEKPLMYAQRKDRVLWHALWLEKMGFGINFDKQKGRFSLVID